MGRPKKITDFSGENAFLSNLYPCSVEYDGVKHKSLQHAYEYQKSLDERDRKYILSCKTGIDAYRAGTFIPEREDWNDIKDSIMKKCLESKFLKNDYIRQRLKNTGKSEIVHKNKKGLINDNYIGKIIMALRNKIGDKD